MCSFLSPQGRHMVLLAISGVSDVLTVFRSGGSGDVVLHVRWMSRTLAVRFV